MSCLGKKLDFPRFIRRTNLRKKWNKIEKLDENEHTTAQKLSRNCQKDDPQVEIV